MIKDLLSSLRMKGALQILEEIHHLKGREEFLIALLKAAWRICSQMQNMSMRL